MGDVWMRVHVCVCVCVCGCIYIMTTLLCSSNDFEFHESPRSSNRKSDPQAFYMVFMVTHDTQSIGKGKVMFWLKEPVPLQKNFNSVLENNIIISLLRLF